MNIDEALKHVTYSWSDTDDVEAIGVLKGEVERLRAELVLAQDQEKRTAAAAADCFKRLERCHDEADKYQARALKAEAENAELRNTYAAAHEAHLKIHAENKELRQSVATMACNHKGIGLPDCRICDPNTKPGAGT